MSLVECLAEVEDPRRLQGQRYGSVALLLIKAVVNNSIDISK